MVQFAHMQKRDQVSFINQRKVRNRQLHTTRNMGEVNAIRLRYAPTAVAYSAPASDADEASASSPFVVVVNVVVVVIRGCD